MREFRATYTWLSLATVAFRSVVSALAPTDYIRDADLGQSGYVGGDHNIDPAVVSQYKQIWNVTFKPDEKHYARPLVFTLDSGRQIIFTASTENVIRTIDAVTGEIINERQVSPPWPMSGAHCETVSKNMGIMGTPTILAEYGVAFFYAKSYIEDYRLPGDATSPMNGVYWFNAVFLDTLLDVYKFPLYIDDVPADNDLRKIFIGGLLLQRPSLVQVGDVIYAGFGGLCDAFNYTGAVVAVNVNTRWVNRWVTQAGPQSSYSDDWALWHGGGAAGISQAGMGLASDGQDVYFSIENGGGSTGANISTTPISGKTHLDVLSTSAVRVSFSHGVQLVDWFKPYDYKDSEGQAIGSGGFSVLDSLFTIGNMTRIGVATGSNSKMYILNLDDMGGYRQGPNGTDGVLQSIVLDGEFAGGIGSYPFEGGYIYVNPGNASLAAYRFHPSISNSSLPIFTPAGRSSASNLHSVGVGMPTVTSRNGESGTGIVWITEPDKGLLAFKAVPVNGSLVELKLPKVAGAGRYSRPVFGDGRVYVVDGMGRLIALGVEANLTAMR